MMEKPDVYIISEDLVFTSTVEFVLGRGDGSLRIENISSFSNLKERNIENTPRIVILDEIITGATCLEIITFLRFNRRLECPIWLFCENIPDLTRKALQRGANRCYTKPFNPRKVAHEIFNEVKS